MTKYERLYTADEVDGMIARAKAAAAQPAPVQQPVNQERESLRAAQGEAVMPLIGPLLDAWESCSETMRGEQPEVDKYLRKINRAMEDVTPPAAPVQPEQEPVAWMRKLFSPELGEFFDYKDGSFAKETDSDGWTPIYTTPPAQPEQEPVLDDADMLLIRRSHVKRAITCLNTAENADLRLVLRDLFALLKTPPAPVQPVGKVIASVPHLRSISVELLPEVPVPPEDSLIYTNPPAAAQPAPVQIQKSCNVCAHKQRYYLDMTGPCKACRFYSNFASVTPPPAQRQWVELTDDEVKHRATFMDKQFHLAFYAGMYQAQQILKEKNNG
jgi:hypothetical protein